MSKLNKVPCQGSLFRFLIQVTYSGYSLTKHVGSQERDDRYIFFLFMEQNLIQLRASLSGFLNIGYSAITKDWPNKYYNYKICKIEAL